MGERQDTYMYQKPTLMSQFGEEKSKNETMNETTHMGGACCVRRAWWLEWFPEFSLIKTMIKRRINTYIVPCALRVLREMLQCCRLQLFNLSHQSGRAVFLLASTLEFKGEK